MVHFLLICALPVIERSCSECAADLPLDTVPAAQVLGYATRYITFTQNLLAGSARQRQYAVRWIAEERNPWGIYPLILALNDDDPSVKGWAAWGLGELRDRRGVIPLVKALKATLQRVDVDDVRHRGKCLPDLTLALEKLTGRNFGYSIDQWENHLLKMGTNVRE